MLESVKRPDGTEIRFEYDALGRRTAKINEATKEITRFTWDGNVPLHEWKYALENRPQIVANELGELSLDKEEPTENLITWIFDEGSFVPSAKITKDDTFSIVSDYIGKPIAAYNGVGNLVWDVEYDIYGNIRSQSKGDKDFIPFRNQGQYEDAELNGLMYNRFRYYDGNSGTYISQDPIRLKGGANLYSYVSNSLILIDVFGLMAKKGKGTDYYRFLSESDVDSMNSGEGIKPKGTGTGAEAIRDHVSGGGYTGYVSMSKGGLDKNFNGGLGAIKIDADKVPSIVQHENVMATLRNSLDKENAKRAQEALSKGAIPQDAITLMSEDEIKKAINDLSKCNK